MYKNWLAAFALAVVSMSVGVNAASAEVWGGTVYAGAFVGKADGDTDWTYTPSGQDASHDADGELYGLNVGWTRQFGSFVVGVEADAAGTDIQGDTSCPNSAFTCASKIDGLASVRVVAGYKMGEWEVYGTVGPAWAKTEISTSSAFNGGATDSTVSGVVYGAGVSFDLNDDWSIRGEYMHYDFDDEDYTVDNNLNVNADMETDAIRIGLNYNF